MKNLSLEDFLKKNPHLTQHFIIDKNNQQSNMFFLISRSKFLNFVDEKVSYYRILLSNFKGKVAIIRELFSGGTLF